MKKLLLLIPFILFAMDKPSLSYLKLHHSDFDGNYEVNGVLSIKWTIKASKKNISKLYSHIRFMKKKIESGHSPRRTDKFFELENKMGKYVHYKIGFENGNMIILKSADNACAFEVVKAHAKLVKEDFMDKGEISKDYSDIGVKIINSPACSDFKKMLTK